MFNGPNLNLLGKREPHIYGTTTIDELESQLRELVGSNARTLDFVQHNSEGACVDAIASALDQRVRFMVVNVGGYAHTSVAIRDALLAVDIPFIEVHISNIYERESFRSVSYLSDIAVGVISGLGIVGYMYATAYALDYLDQDG